MSESNEDSLERNYIIKVETKDDQPVKVSIQAHVNTFTFNHSKYDIEVFNKILTENEYKEVLRNASKTIGEAYSSKKNFDIIDIPKYMDFGATTVMIAVVVFAISLYCSFAFDDLEILGTIIAMTSITVVFVVGFTLSVSNFTRKLKTFRHFNDLIEERMIDYVKEVNSKFSTFQLAFEFGESTFSRTIKRKKELVPILIFHLKQKGNSSIRSEIETGRKERYGSSEREKINDVYKNGVNVRMSMNERYEDDDVIL